MKKNIFKAGDIVINENGVRDVVVSVPGMKKYDRMNFIDGGELGFVLENENWGFQKDWKLAPKKRGRPSVKTSNKRKELMKKAEEVTTKKYSEFDLHNAKEEARQEGFEAAQKLNKLAEEVANDFQKWSKKRAITGILVNLAIIALAAVTVFVMFRNTHLAALALASK